MASEMHHVLCLPRQQCVAGNARAKAGATDMPKRLRTLGTLAASVAMSTAMLGLLSVSGCSSPSDAGAAGNSTTSGTAGSANAGTGGTQQGGAGVNVGSGGDGVIGAGGGGGASPVISDGGGGSPASGGAGSGGDAAMIDPGDTKPWRPLNVTATPGQHTHTYAGASNGLDNPAAKMMGKLSGDLGVSGGGYQQDRGKRGFHR